MANKMIPKTDGRIQTPGLESDFSAPLFPGLFDLPVMSISNKPDPFVYCPMGKAHLEIGQKVQIRNMDGSGEWCFAWVLKKIHNEDGYPHPWFLVGTQHQTQMDL
jgi:hypothetical protein